MYGTYIYLHLTSLVPWSGSRYRFLNIEDNEDVFSTGNRGFSHCHGYVVLEGTPLKTNMEHHHQGLEDHFPF